MKKQIVGVAVLAGILFACHHWVSKNSTQSENKNQQLRKADWLLGTWQKPSAKGILTESWQKLNDSTFVGQSNFVSGSDTLSSETIRLEQRSGKLYYIPTVTDQNNGKPIIFSQTSLTDSSVTFENPEHDFPQKIEYRFQKPDSLIAEVSAMKEGKWKMLTFRMERLK